MKILIAVDGSKHTQKAIDYLVKHRATLVDGHELTVVNVCSGIPHHAARHVSKSVLDDYYAEESGKVVEPLKTALAAHQIANYMLDLRHGNAAEEILKSAAAMHADLIVMASHGRKGIKRLLLGSETQHVLTHSDLPVLVLR